MRRSKVDRTIIGLDIGSDSVKMLKGMKKDGKIFVSDFACRKYQASHGKSDVVSRHIQELLSSVADAKRISKFRIHSNISGRDLCIRVVKLPVMPEQEIYQAIRSKIRKYVSPDIDQVIFSFLVLGDIEEKDIKKLEVVFAAIQKTFFDEYLQSFKLIGVQPAIITSSCFSGWNLTREIGLNQGATSLMLINIDSQETDLTVYRENRFVFTRNISIGGRGFTDKLKGQTQFSLEREQDVKLLWALEEQKPPVETPEQAQIMNIRKLLHEEADILCKEIGLTADHYYQITHGRRINKCIILGEGAQIGGLVDFLKQRLEMSVEGLHIPEDKLELPVDKAEEFKRNLPLYAQALGALLSRPDDINLLAKTPAKAKKGAQQLIKLFALPKITTKAVIGLICLGLILFAFLKGFNLYYARQIKSYKIIRDKLQDRTMQLMQIKRKVDILDFEKKFYLRLLKEYPAYPVIIAEICQAIPSANIILDELRFYSGQKKTPSVKAPSAVKFTINGRALGKDATSAMVTEFVLALERCGYFENISVAINGKLPSAGMRRPAEKELPLKAAKELGFVIDGIVRLKD